MEKENIFHGNELIQIQIAKSLGYEVDETLTPLQRSYSLSTITEDIYFQSFFYLSQRFGVHQKYDTVKDCGLWNFKVKNYDIQLRLNTSWLIVMIFGNKHENELSKQNLSNYSFRTPYMMACRRQSKKKRHLLVDTTTETRTGEEVAILQSLYPKFCEENGIDLNIKNENFDNEYGMKWFKYVEKYNDSTIGVNRSDYKDYGHYYKNAKTKHALRTLDQFLKNMLTPVYIRDCAYSIKGRIKDKDLPNCRRYENNVKIEFEPPLNNKF